MTGDNSCSEVRVQELQPRDAAELLKDRLVAAGWFPSLLGNAAGWCCTMSSAKYRSFASGCGQTALAALIAADANRISMEANPQYRM